MKKAARSGIGKGGKLRVLDGQIRQHFDGKKSKVFLFQGLIEQLDFKVFGHCNEFWLIAQVSLGHALLQREWGGALSRAKEDTGRIRAVPGVHNRP